MMQEDHGHHHHHHHHHSHGHGHGHGGNCCGGHVSAESPSQEGVQDEGVLGELFTAVRYGFRTQVQNILEKNKDLVNALDSQGYSCAHWASKRGDIPVLEILQTFNADFGLRTTSDVGMNPIHWAASDGKIVAVKFLLDNRQDINSQDLNGCTPIIIAAQHNQINTVIFLLQNGADITLRDQNGDSALHWAAYKGHAELVALLAYHMPREVDHCDTYGQTPLHLASLRGNVDSVEYLVTYCHSDTTIRDKQGQTPLDLTVKKNQFITEWVLRQLLYPNIFAFIKSLGTHRLRSARVIRSLLIGSREREYAVWAWRVVFISNFLGSITTISYAMNEVLSDMYWMHQSNTMLQLIWWIMFTLCLFKSPGFVKDAENDSKNSYANGLAMIGQIGSTMESLHSANPESDVPYLCHTCRVRRPLRSKHCKVLRRCVQKFDHFCPFVGNTVGRDNYKYFIGLLFMHTICGLLWGITTVILLRRQFSYLLLAFFLYSGMWYLIVGSLFSYHIQLIAKNLTTNEHSNMHKYSYLRDAYNLYDNPYCKEDLWSNLLDALFPSTVDHYTRDTVRR